MKAVLFAGPTLARARSIDPDLPLTDLDVRAPVKRGDIATLITQQAPGRIALVDGLFHTEIAVGHLEIRTALSKGWEVWGLASMGAIRAREMNSLGMKGYGRVYELYCQEGVDFRDDEVTLMHGNHPDYRELSEPLVHIREALDDLVREGVLSDGQRGSIILELEEMWYADRTLVWLLQRLREMVPGYAERLPSFLAGFDRYRIKSLDLIRFLRAGLLGS